MKFIWKTLVVGLLALGVAACAAPGLQLDATSKMQPEGSQFSKSLFDEYLALSKMEYDEGHYGASDYYADKARAAAQGETVEPTKIGERFLPGASKWAEPRELRPRLIALLNASARDSQAPLAARAQAKFDCWLEELEENHQPDDIAGCRQAFLAALDELEAAMAPQPAPAPAPAPAPVAAPAPAAPAAFLIFFDWDSATVTKQATDILTEALQAARTSGSTSAQLIGHADTSGPQGYNQGLSMRRAEAVQAELKRLGLVDVQFDLVARGETDPLVPTGDGIREPQNRRVQVLLK